MEEFGFNQNNETYEIDTCCSNCGNVEKRQVPKGMSLNEVKCNYCDVPGLSIYTHIIKSYENEHNKPRNSQCDHKWIFFGSVNDLDSWNLDFYCEHCLEFQRVKDPKFLVK